MSNKIENELLPFAKKLHDWDANVTAIKRGTKRPAHKWEYLQTQRQTLEELERLPWSDAAAIGVINGSGDFRFFDIDAPKDEDGRVVQAVPETVLLTALKTAGLPDSYQWSYQSGSGAGWGFVVRCAEPLPESLTAASGIVTGAPRDGLAFDHLELRWSSGQTVIHGAHPDGPGYRWRLGEEPFVLPALLSAERVAAAFLSIAEIRVPDEQPEELPGAFQTPSCRYGQAALNDAMRQVSTAPRGDRNNTLFRQTAGLVELVNGGELARDEVERGMTTAALAAGLSPDEIATTIKSAFGSVTASRTAPVRSRENGHLTKQHRTTDGSPGPAEKQVTPDTEQATFFRRDDTGNADRFVSLYSNDVRYDHTSKQWLIWTGKHWKRDDNMGIQRLAKMTARSIFEEAAEAARIGRDSEAEELAKWARTSAAESRRNAMLNLARSELPIAITNDRLNSNALLINVQNGTLDLRTNKLKEHDRSDLLTYVLSVPYEPTAACPNWNAFIARVAGEDVTLANFMARAVGYSLSGSTSEQCLFFLYGQGANGKSTFIETIMTLMGTLGHKARVQALLSNERDRVPNEIAALVGKRMVVGSELADGARLNESLVKDLTGGDTVSARYLYGEPFSFRPAFKLWLYGNHKPLITGTDEGIWRRIHLIPFTVPIPKPEQDPALPAKLRSELTGILAWAVEGWKEYQRLGLAVPPAITNATRAYREESDILGLFIRELCVKGPNMTARGGELYDQYRSWAELNGTSPLSNVRFARGLEERGFSKTKSSSGHMVYEGIGLLTESDDQ